MADEASAMYIHCRKVYDLMFERATRQKADGEIDIIVYEGMLTRLVTDDLGLPVPYYTALRRALLGMGCVRQLRRGGGPSPSQWELLVTPTLELWNAWAEGVSAESTAKGTESSTSDMSHISRRILRLETILGIADQPLID